MALIWETWGLGTQILCLLWVSYLHTKVCHQQTGEEGKFWSGMVGEDEMIFVTGWAGLHTPLNCPIKLLPCYQLSLYSEINGWREWDDVCAGVQREDGGGVPRSLGDTLPGGWVARWVGCQVARQVSRQPGGWSSSIDQTRYLVRFPDPPPTHLTTSSSSGSSIEGSPRVTGRMRMKVVCDRIFMPYFHSAAPKHILCCWQFVEGTGDREVRQIGRGKSWERRSASSLIATELVMKPAA